jgi:phosphate acetyltransferase
MTSLFIASAEPETGKSAVALGILEQLTRRVGRVAVYRPIVRAGEQPDYVLEMLLQHGGVTTRYEEAVGVTYDDVHADPDAALARIVERYHAIEGGHDAVIVVGSDYTDVGTPTELAYNARIAANLGAPVLLIVRGTGRTASTHVRGHGGARARGSLRASVRRSRQSCPAPRAGGRSR